MTTSNVPNTRQATTPPAPVLGSLPANTTVAQARDAIHTFLTVNVVLDVVFAALYVLLAYRIRVGRNWAGVALTVIVVLFGLFDIVNGTDVITLVSVVVELAAVVLLYLRSSRNYFAETRPAT